MGQFNFKGDKSWIVIAALVMFATPIGIVALIAKILYMVYMNQNSEDASSRTGTYNNHPSSWDSAEDSSQRPLNDLEENLSNIETDLKASFSEWDETHETMTQKYDRDALPVVGLEGTNHIIDVWVDDELSLDEVATMDPLATEHLEDELNASLGALKVEDSVPVDTDVDLTFVDVHIDTEITFDNEPEDHDHVGEKPLKVVVCTMCGEENRIYKIDVFETPCCEKCGMLLLDRS